MLLHRSSLITLIGPGVSNWVDFNLRIPLPVHVELCRIALRLSQFILRLRFRYLLAKRYVKLLLLLLVVDDFCNLNMVSGIVFCDGLRPISPGI